MSLESPNSHRAGHARWIAKKLARYALAGASGTRMALAAKPPGGNGPVRVLTYHRFGIASRDPFCVRPDAFAQQMSWLVSRGLVVSLADLEAFLDGDRPLPEGSVLVTIDDGDASVFSRALPVLRRFELSAVLFVIAGKIGQPGFLTSDQLRTLAAEGIAIGSHSMTHPNLAALSSDATWDELRRSKQTLEDLVNVEVCAFAYPYGTRQAYDERTASQAASAGYRLAFTSQHGALWPGSSRMTLPRVKVEGGDPPWMFPWLCRGAMDAWRWVDQSLWALQKPLPLHPESSFEQQGP